MEWAKYVNILPVGYLGATLAFSFALFELSLSLAFSLFQQPFFGHIKIKRKIMQIPDNVSIGACFLLKHISHIRAYQMSYYTTKYKIFSVDSGWLSSIHLALNGINA